ncbi:hypothetical protein [Streptomyces clavuligerus]|uniref:Uncharacterized protein n=1 Tax=Streptomyces clavuligerus TaxID=1901 RepID=B5GRL7_STRCL|nr:hypothetical protein [Streptomyces clavuligerus]ANW17455.1 hypothetical protein BB341_04050 [Streptomyces clavuligerus]AXU12003.1 hypothetical protein D1794_04220 [Streptomyces clavuligerus]EDY48963.1 hypothetical protein SSCG_01991 [Streptomyces clavuligerus]EFG10054.1 Hypothetical protein SCLAV_4981 [Streptomyces clavuligerus]MBY6301854.1 hypothetical protein [Streptomyces clavuligerus]
MYTASQYPSAIPLALCFLVAALGAFGFSGYGFRAVTEGHRAKGVSVVARSGAALSVAACLAVYAWGAVHLFLDESGTAEACRSAAPEQFASVNRYSVSYVPPALHCHVPGGASYEAAVPGYVTPAMIALGLIAASLLIVSVLETKQQGRHEPAKEKKL